MRFRSGVLFVISGVLTSVTVVRLKMAAASNCGILLYEQGELAMCIGVSLTGVTLTFTLGLLAVVSFLIAGVDTLHNSGYVEQDLFAAFGVEKEDEGVSQSMQDRGQRLAERTIYTNNPRDHSGTSTDHNEEAKDDVEK